MQNTILLSLWNHSPAHIRTRLRIELMRIRIAHNYQQYDGSIIISHEGCGLVVFSIAGGTSEDERCCIWCREFELKFILEQDLSIR